MNKLEYWNVLETSISTRDLTRCGIALALRAVRQRTRTLADPSPDGQRRFLFLFIF